jgi:DDE superfamily endonuclease
MNVRRAIQDISTNTPRKIFAILPKGKDIVAVILGKYGPASDINLFREIQLQFNSKQTFKGDKGFIGGKNISTPHKKPKGGELTKEQKEGDKIFSGKRVFVEHIIRMVKIFRIGQQRFRLRFSNYERVMSVICGLVRLRIESIIL